MHVQLTMCSLSNNHLLNSDNNESLKPANESAIKYQHLSEFVDGSLAQFIYYKCAMSDKLIVMGILSDKLPCDGEAGTSTGTVQSLITH